MCLLNCSNQSWLASLIYLSNSPAFQIPIILTVPIGICQPLTQMTCVIIWFFYIQWIQGWGWFLSNFYMLLQFSRYQTNINSSFCMKISIVCAKMIKFWNTYRMTVFKCLKSKHPKDQIGKNFHWIDVPRRQYTFFSRPKSRHHYWFRVTSSFLVIHVGFNVLLSMELLAESLYFIYRLTKIIPQSEIQHHLHLLKHWMCYAKL